MESTCVALEILRSLQNFPRPKIFYVVFANPSFIPDFIMYILRYTHWKPRHKFSYANEFLYMYVYLY